MPLKFRVREGPWKELFSASWSGSEAELYENAESVFLAIVFEKKSRGATEAAMEFYHVFLAEGEMEGFVERLPKECLLVEKHEKGQTVKFLLIESGSGYSRWKEEAFTKETNDLLEALADSRELVLELASTYSINLTPLHKTSAKTRNFFLSQSMVPPLLSDISAGGEIEPGTTSGLESVMVPAMPRTRAGVGIVLGKTRDGTLVEEPLSLFSGTIVSGGTQPERNHAMQLLIESILLTNANVAVLDWGNQFLGLARPTQQREALKQMAPSLDAIGFPTKHYSIPKELHININQLSANTVGEWLGIGNSEASKVIPEAMKIEAQSLDDWIAQLKRLGETQKASLFQSMRAIRAIRLVSVQIPKEWFGGKNNLEELVSFGVGGIGRANIVQLSALNEKASALFSESVSKEFLLWVQTKPDSGGIRAAIAIPEIQKTTAIDHRTELGKSLAQLSKELQKQHVAVLWSVEDENMLPAEVNQSAPTHVNVIAGSDVSVRPEDGKGYRVQLHPGLSERVR